MLRLSTHVDRLNPGVFKPDAEAGPMFEDADDVDGRTVVKSLIG